MTKPNKDAEVGIVVPTMNRPDFMIRQLNYYADLNFPYTLYIADSSDTENALKLQREIDRLKNKLNVSYEPYPAGDGAKCLIQLLSRVKEKYVTFIGDDDYNVPNTIFACAEFLENNPDYETATGQSVTIRVENNGAYGTLTGIHDYPRYSIEANTASERLHDHFCIHFSSIIAAVLPTQNMLKYFQDSYEIEDIPIKCEMVPCGLMIIAGKSKVLDKIGLVRQIHTRHFRNPDIFDQITQSIWPKSYALTKKILAEALIKKDGISLAIAEETVKKSFWANINNQLSSAYPQYLALASSIPRRTIDKTKIRAKIATYLPFIKRIYRRFVRPILTTKEQLHYEVLQPSSRYYKDFQPIFKSLTKPR